MQVFKDYFIELLFFFFCFANLVGFGIPQPLLFFPIFILACVRLPIPCLAFMCLNFMKDVNHAFFFLNYHISGFAPLTVLIGLFLMKDFLSEHFQDLLRQGTRLWIIMGYLLITYILAQNYHHQSGKVGTLLTTAVLSYISYAYILYNRKCCDFYKMAIYGILFAVFLLQLNIDTNHYGHLQSFFDFGFYRREIGVDMYENLASTGVIYATHYQFFGTIVTICVSLLFATTKVDAPHIILLSALSLIAVGYTGARQYLGILFILFVLYTLLSPTNLLFKSLFIIVAGSVAIFIIQQSLLSDYFMKIEEEGVFKGSGRDFTIEQGFRLFEKNPLLGVGFAGYHYHRDYTAYPHNMIVEMLAELGSIGTIIVFYIFLSYKKSLLLMYNNNRQFMGLYIVLAFFLRAMVSLSFGHNSILFASFFALPFIAHKNITRLKFHE